MVPKERQPLVMYGFEWALHYDRFQVELAMFRKNIPAGRPVVEETETHTASEEISQGRLFHYREICKILWPKLVCNEWTDIMHEAFCEPEKTLITGPASAGKSEEMARFSVVWMWAFYPNYAIPVTSTSVQMSRKRIWARIKTMFNSARDQARKPISKGGLGYELPGNLVDSSTEIQSVKGDSEHAIAIVPGSQKYSADGVTKVKGWHAKYVLVLADELQDMTDEIIVACANLRAGTMEFKFIGSGNGCSWVNTMGKEMMPVSGNPESVTVEMDKWEIEDGYCHHLDGLKSPNIIEPGKYPWNLSEDEVEKIKRKYGEDSLQYWQMVRGFPPPDDSFHAVVSESLLIKFNALKSGELAEGWEHHASLDPGFGGDSCVLKLAKVGVLITEKPEDARMGVVFADRIEIQLKSSKTDPLDFQIAEQVIEICKAKGIKPKNFSIDGTGTGRGVAAIIRRQWSNEIHVIEYGAKASEFPVGPLDPTKGCDAYWNYVTEIYFGVRQFVERDQVRGITPQMARAFGCRKFITKNGRLLLESKQEAKKVLGRSPDEEDASAMLIDNLRKQGYFAGPMGFDRHWREMVQEAGSLDGDYAQTDEILMV